MEFLRRLQPLTDGLGAVVTAPADRDIMQLDTAEVRQLLATHRVLLLRGFHVDLARFRAFSDRFANQFLVHFSPSTRHTLSEDQTVVDVIKGNDRIHLHGEMYYAPKRPDTLFLHCTVPPREGGETTVCDASRFYDALRAPLQELFERKRIRYEHTRGQAEIAQAYHWQSIEDALRGFAALGYANVRRTPGAQAVTFEHVESAVVTTPSGRKGFLNSIVNMKHTPRKTYRPRVTFEDGEELSDALVDEIDAIGEQLAFGIQWQAEDVLFVDNQSVLHGRRAFTGSRSIAIRFGVAAAAQQVAP